MRCDIPCGLSFSSRYAVLVLNGKEPAVGEEELEAKVRAIADSIDEKVGLAVMHFPRIQSLVARLLGDGGRLW